MNGQIKVIVSRAPALIPGMTQMMRKVGAPLILVPESYTLTAEQALMQVLPGKGLIGTQVFSTTSLIREIQERAGKPDSTSISADGRHMILSLLLMKHRDELLFYKENAGQISMAQKLSQQLGDLTDGGIDPDMLESAARGMDSSTAYKLHDIALIWREYRKVLDMGYADPDSKWNSCMERLESIGLIQGMDLLIYGFDYININLTRLVLTAYPLVNSVTIGLVSDTGCEDDHIFEFASNSVKRFVRRMRDSGIPVTVEPYRLPESTADAGIRYVEQNIFSMKRSRRVPDLSAVELYHAPDTTAECLYIAQRLIEWRRQGIEWRDMAVAVCDEGTIPSMLPLIMSAAGIPYTHRSGTPMLLSEYAQYFISTLRCVRSGLKQDEMIKLIKSGFTSLTEDEMMDLENYVREHGIDRNKWLKPFPHEEGDEKTAHLDELRKAVAEPVAALRRTLSSKKCTGRKAAEAIYEHMISTGAYETLLRRERQLIDSGMTETADRDRQVWDAVNDLLDQLASFAREIHLTVDELCTMLSSSVSAKTIKSLPQVADSVVISSPNMFFSPGLRAVVAAGLQDRQISAPAALLTQSECGELVPDSEGSSGIGMTRREAAARAKQDVYQAIACATEKLLFTSSVAQPNGKVLTPSQIFRDADDLLKEHAPQNRHGGAVTDGLVPFMPRFAVERLAVKLRASKDGRDDFLTDPDNVWRQSLSYLYNDGKWHDSVKSVLDGLHVKLIGKGIPPEMADMLYGRDRLSVSSLETAGTCMYWAFLSYALRVHQRRDFTFETDSEGTFSHDVLQRFFDAAMKDPSYPVLDDGQIDGILDPIINELTAEWEDGALDKNTSAKFRGEEIVGKVRTAVTVMAKAIRRIPHFTPVGMEVGFGRMRSDGELHFPPVKITLDDGRDVTVSGKIDRVDTAELGGSEAVLVYDFKSSDKEVHGDALDAGLQIQLPIYLIAVEKGMPDHVLAGALYQPVKDVLIEAEDGDEETLSEKMDEQLRAKGIFLDDERIKAACYPLKIPSRASKSDVINALSAEDIHKVMERGRESAKRIAERMFSGDTAPSPLQEGSVSPCSYCGMADACPIDPRLEGGRVRKLTPSDTEDNDGSVQ